VEINNLSSAQRSVAYPAEQRLRTEELRVQDRNRDDEQKRETETRNAAPERTADEPARRSGPIPRGSLVDIAV
jgi:hypothetical protein